MLSAYCDTADKAVGFEFWILGQGMASLYFK